MSYASIAEYLKSTSTQSLPLELINQVLEPLFEQRVFSFESILNSTDDELDVLLASRLYSYDYSGSRSDKIKQAIELLTPTFPPDEKFVVSAPKFFQYLELSDEELNLRLNIVLSSVLGPGIVGPNLAHIRASLYSLSQLEKIKYLLRYELLNNFSGKLDLWSSEGGKGRRGKPKIRPTSGFLWQMLRPSSGFLWQMLMLYPKEYIQAYPFLSRYSPLNQSLIIAQMLIRGIPAGPIATFREWRKLGYSVRKGEKALGMIQPYVRTWKSKDDADEGQMNSYTDFTFRRNWFARSQVKPTSNKTPSEIGSTAFSLPTAIQNFNASASIDRRLSPDVNRETVLKEILRDVLNDDRIEVNPSLSKTVMDLVLLAMGEETPTLSFSLRQMYDEGERGSNKIPSLIKRVLEYGL